MAPRLPRRLEYIPVDDLPEDPRNPKMHAGPDMDASVERFGYTEPVLIDERTGMLVSGHGRKAALVRARDTGADVPDGVVVRSGVWLAPVVRGWSSADDAEAAAYMVAANRLVEAGGWDGSALETLLSELAPTDMGLIGTGFTSAELDDLIASLAPVDSDGLAAGGQTHVEFDANKAKTVECPECGHEWLIQG